jgi:hypothetical protein
MPLRKKTKLSIENFDMPLSYRVNERRNRFSVAENVFWNQSRLDTRFGTDRFNAVALPSNVLSLSYFKDTSGTRYNLAKSLGIIYKLSETGAHTELKTGLVVSTKHRGLTMNNRHIVAADSDGLFSYNGTVFTQLGQAVPAKPTATLVNSQGALANDTYTVKITYYSSTTGFETNASLASTPVTTSTPNSRITVTKPAAPDNLTIDKYRVYISDDDITWYFVATEALADDYKIDANTLSTQVPPIDHDVWPAGGGKYLAEFNRKLVVAGLSTFKNDVIFSSQDYPDGYDLTETGVTLFAGADGEITGLATGFFNDSVLDPYLVVFKRRSTWIYSEIGDLPKFEKIDGRVGAVSGDNITVRNGDVYFLSDQGWKVIHNGMIVQNEIGESATLGLGDVDDVFRRTNFDYSITKATLSSSFSVYYGELDQFISWIGDNGNTAYNRAYVYEFAIGGFKTYNFAVNATCACISEDSLDNEQVLYGTLNGYIHKHSKVVERKDVSSGGGFVSYNARVRLIWIQGDDRDKSHNFRGLYLTSLAGAKTILMKGYVNYVLSNPIEDNFEFTEDGFILGVGILGVNKLAPATRTANEYIDINRSGRNIMLEFSLNLIESNMGLVDLQMDFQTNGNRN